MLEEWYSRFSGDSDLTDLVTTGKILAIDPGPDSARGRGSSSL